MNKYAGKTVWITGASSGIGKEFALQCASAGANIILSSRREDELQKISESITSMHNVKCYVIPLDLTAPATIQHAAHQIMDKKIPVNILVNNGGISQRSLVLETPIDIDRKVFEINYFGAVNVTKAILPYMIQQGGGHIVVISSVVGIFGFPLRSAYSASKHALHGFFETVRAELVKDNIKVTIVCPGRIVTNISNNAITKDGSKYGKMDEGQAKGMPVEKCVRKIISSVASNKKEVWVGGKEVAMAYIRKYIPGLFYSLASKVKPT